MDMPEFAKYRYLVVKNDDPACFDAWWIHPRGRLSAVDGDEFRSLAGVLERVESPERIGLSYSGAHAMSVFRTLRAV